MSQAETLRALVLIGVMTLVTAAIRFLPFLVFSKGTPGVLRYLGGVLPPAIMAMLVVYCLKSTTLLTAPHGLPELISVALVVGLHKWRHNTLLSIVAGTVCYMVMVQVVFA